MTTAEKQAVFDKCLEKSHLFDGIGSASAPTLMTLFGCMRSRLESHNATADDKGAFVAALTNAIQHDPALARNKNAEQKVELLKLVEASFNKKPFTPSTSFMLAAEVNFLKAVHF
jgi:hypothetical protein